MKQTAIGIDLGTYNSAAAIALGESQVHMIRSQDGETVQGTVFPSFVKFGLDGEPQTFGEQARQQMTVAPEFVVWGAKRLIGRAYDEVEEERRRFQYPIARDVEGMVVIPIGPRRYTPMEISSSLLSHIKQAAEADYNPYVIGTVHKAVVTHPAYFDARQISETREAARRAGFSVVELIPEPVAAALAYGELLGEYSKNKSSFVLAIDWGAGTLDIVLMNLVTDDEGRPRADNVRPACGNVRLGGIDLDNALIDRAIEIYRLDKLRSLQTLSARENESDRQQEDYRITLRRFFVRLSGEDLRILCYDLHVDYDDLQGESKITKAASLVQYLEHRNRLADLLEAGKRLRNDIPWDNVYLPVTMNPSDNRSQLSQLLRTLGDLRVRVEQAKINLSTRQAIKETIVYQGEQVTIKMARTKRDCLDRERDWIILEDVLRPLLQSFCQHIEFAIKESGLGAEDIDYVLLIGGPMYMPCVRRVVAEVFKKNRKVSRQLQEIGRSAFPVKPTECVARGAALYAERFGPIPPRGELAYDYGLLLHRAPLPPQGRIVLARGQRVPCENSLGPLVCPGKPGMDIPVSLYKREVGPGGDRYIVMGDYRFFPAFDSGGAARFRGTLKADGDGVISATLTDCRAEGAPLEMPRLSEHRGWALGGPPIDIGEAYVREISDEPLLPIEADRVEATRRNADEALTFAEIALRERDELLRDSQASAEVREQVEYVQEALRLLPHGEAQHEDWARVRHGVEMLLNSLVRLGVIREGDV